MEQLLKLTAPDCCICQKILLTKQQADDIIILAKIANIYWEAIS